MHTAKGSDKGDFLTIQEAASLLNVTPATLRNWDRSGKLKPLRHPMNGYRMYQRADLEMLRQAGRPASGTPYAPTLDVRGAKEQEHLVQFYESDDALVISVAAYFAPALRKNGACIAIATPEHSEEIRKRLKTHRIDAAKAEKEGRLVFADARKMLKEIMAEGLPDPKRFAANVGEKLAGLTLRFKPVRAFGEMVALLWEADNKQAALRLEELWHDLCEERPISVLCAYPLRFFAGSQNEEFLEAVCQRHTHAMPSEHYTGLKTQGERLRHVLKLQQQAHSLEHEITQRRQLEQSMQEREQEYMDFFENAAEGIQKVGADGTVLWANKAQLALLGYEPGEYIGQPVAKFHMNEATAHDIFCRLKNGETLHMYEAVLRGKHGPKHVLISSNAYYKNGEFAYSRCFTRDITSRKQAEATLRERERQLNVVVNHAPVYMARCDRECRYLFVNRGYAERFGLPAEAFTGRTVEEMLGREVYLQLRPYIDQVLRGERVAFDTQLPYANGTRTVHAAYEPEYDEQGKVVSWVVVVSDVTESRREQEAKALLAAVVESSQDAIITKTLEGRILSWNRSAERLYGHTEQEAIGQPITIIIPPDRHQEERMILDRLRKGERIEHYETIRMAKDGKLIYVSLAVSPVSDASGNIIAASKVARDITQQKRIEQELQEALERAKAANESKSEFLANMSHELRTPLNAVIGIASLLQTPSLSAAKQHEFAKTLQLSAQQLLDLINDLLDVSKIEMQQMQLERITFSIDEIMEEIVSVHSLKAKEKGIALEACGPDCTGPWVMGDPLRFRQVLLNIVGNAVKFTDQGSVTISYSCKEIAETGQVEVQVTVEDTGIGIAPQQLENIFSKFTQGDTSITRKYGGTGLGLSICKMLVELMGGSISVESKPSVGSRFTVSVPFPQSQPGHATLPAEAGEKIGEKQKEKSAKYHVLLVEDYPANILVATTMLEILGCSYKVANTGKEALKILRKETFDMVLMDVQMPEMDGFEATRKIRQWERENGRRPLKVVGMTAHALKGDKERCLEAGMDDYISKPFHQEELEERLSTLPSARKA